VDEQAAASDSGEFLREGLRALIGIARNGNGGAPSAHDAAPGQAAHITRSRRPSS
jgi:hypothetical protein